jgi:hypothetical protein
MPKSSQPFLGGPPVSFAEAYPDIGAFTIEISQGDLVWGASDALGAARSFSPENPPPPVVACINRLCRDGGFNLDTYLSQANGALPWTLDQTFRCNGHEGRANGRSCSNAFRVKMHFEPK